MEHRFSPEIINLLEQHKMLNKQVCAKQVWHQHPRATAGFDHENIAINTMSDRIAEKSATTSASSLLSPHYALI
jgi:hypothetical protein